MSARQSINVAVTVTPGQSQRARREVCELLATFIVQHSGNQDSASAKCASVKINSKSK